MTTLYGDAKALHLLHVHNALTRNSLNAHRGREIKHTGDGIMASFHRSTGCGGVCDCHPEGVYRV